MREFEKAAMPIGEQIAYLEGYREGYCDCAETCEMNIEERVNVVTSYVRFRMSELREEEHESENVPELG